MNVMLVKPPASRMVRGLGAGGSGRWRRIARRHHRRRGTPLRLRGSPRGAPRRSHDEGAAARPSRSMRTRPKRSRSEAGGAQRGARQVGGGASSSRLSSSTAGAKGGRREPERHDEEEAPRPPSEAIEARRARPGDHPDVQRSESVREPAPAARCWRNPTVSSASATGTASAAPPLERRAPRARPGARAPGPPPATPARDDEPRPQARAADRKIARAPADQEERSERERVHSHDQLQFRGAVPRSRWRSPAGRPSRPCRRASRAGRRRTAAPAPRRATGQHFPRDPHAS